MGEHEHDQKRAPEGAGGAEETSKGAKDPGGPIQVLVDRLGPAAAKVVLRRRAAKRAAENKSAGGRPSHLEQVLETGGGAQSPDLFAAGGDIREGATAEEVRLNPAANHVAARHVSRAARSDPARVDGEVEVVATVDASKVVSRSPSQSM